MSGTSEVHFRGLSLKRSARGAGWVVCVCINAVFGHVLIWTMEPWIVFILDSSLHRKPGSSTGTWKRDPKHRPCRFLMLFEHARAPGKAAVYPFFASRCLPHYHPLQEHQFCAKFSGRDVKALQSHSGLQKRRLFLSAPCFKTKLVFCEAHIFNFSH